MRRKQKTIKNEFSLTGAGLHTGEKVTLCFKPAPVNAGIRFQRVDAESHPVIPADIDYVVANNLRCTSLGKKDIVIHTVEHLMSILSGEEIDNLLIEIDGGEIPGLDGSGKDFLAAVQKAGVQEQEEDIHAFAVKETVSVSSGNASLTVFPSEDFRISYMLDYDHPHLKSQLVEFVLTKDVFEKDIALCRTFCLEKEADYLRSQGLGKGANHKNTLVVGDNGVIDNELRYADEFARHKVLDFIGDLSLFGVPLKGHFVALRSGHNLNLAMLRKLRDQKKRYESQGSARVAELPEGKEIRIEQIMKILPHRYPFLLVDRVIEIEKGQRAVGVKNVTMNEEFFKGHFPTRPVMPGVLMVEAMAQTAGVAILSGQENPGKLAFFMAVDKVKFRKVVSPGDQLIMEVTVTKCRPRVAQARGVAKVDGAVVAEADMTFSFGDESYLK